MGYSVSSCWIFSILIAVISPYLFRYIGRWTFFILLISTILSGIKYYFLIIETKDKTPEQIRKEFETTNTKELKIENVAEINIERKTIDSEHGIHAEL